jgi:hypothetical protein
LETQGYGKSKDLPAGAAGGFVISSQSICEDTSEMLLKKFSKSMQVELNDPSGRKIFTIRSDSRSVQTIDLEGEEHTEWRFYVMPLLEGEFPQIQLHHASLRSQAGLSYQVSTPIPTFY